MFAGNDAGIAGLIATGKKRGKNRPRSRDGDGSIAASGTAARAS
ncbi:hypothetical protein OHAE_1593 [Ochrobactrum soli]|uniref:Uncharacterized protein n=1 Tax=Ochrobactrum soli TaxID=2448455 RepID=A0A2P9HNM8_9HYPH|nr:hypothetical protein OHAE_1593 [[Ochrobactrum] soli]